LFAKHAQHVVLVHFQSPCSLRELLLTGLAVDTAKSIGEALLQLRDCSVFDSAGAGDWPARLAVSLEGQKLKGILLLHLIMAGVSSL